MKDTVHKIKRLKEEKNAVIMAHYYVEDEVQEIADFVGDSYYLSHMATKTDSDVIVICGVSFMGESAKILNPDKKVLIPEAEADCPMAHMTAAEKIEQVRKKYEDIAVVCYVNSTAEIKAKSDVCVTSSNALKIVSALPNKNIFFVPDKNLAHFIAGQLPEKNFIFNDGFCYVHDEITRQQVLEEKKRHPEAPVLVHPESRPEVVDIADYVGSTSGIIDFATNSASDEFIILTEAGVLYELKKKNPGKRFFTVGSGQICRGMKKITLESVLNALEEDTWEVDMESQLIRDAKAPMERMLEMSE